MKNVKITFATLSIAFMVVFSSCKKTTIPDPTPDPTPAATTSGFTWKENGVAYAADSAWFYTATRIIVFYGSGANRRGISISFPATANGVFPIPNPTFLSYTVGVAANPVQGTSGNLTITNYDNTNNRLSGTFTNVTVGSNILTEGTFTNLPKR